MSFTTIFKVSLRSLGRNPIRSFLSCLGIGIVAVILAMAIGEVPEVDVRRDITAGSVYGVYSTNDVNQTKMWLKDNAPVGFPWGNRNPTHQ